MIWNLLVTVNLVTIVAPDSEAKPVSQHLFFGILDISNPFKFMISW